MAPAKAKEIAPAEQKPAELEPVPESHNAPASHGSETIGSAPSFSALDSQDSSGSAGSKKILIAAVVLLAVAALGYFGWTSLGQHKAARPVAQPVSAPQPTETQVATSVSVTGSAKAPEPKASATAKATPGKPVPPTTTVKKVDVGY